MPRSNAIRVVLAVALAGGALLAAGCGGHAMAPVTHASTARHLTSTAGGLALGQVVRIRSLPQRAPAAAVMLQADQPIDPGTAENGATGGSCTADQVWPSTAPGGGQTVTVRFVNLPVRVANTGRTPVRIEIDADVTDDRGREASAVLSANQEWPGPHGRRPDWTSSQGPPIAPGAIVTRYITFPVATGSTITSIALSAQRVRSGGVETMVPDGVRFRGP
jgi:hypothetical protein